ncbi:MAG: universal stress protein [Paracoccaceae bacterium]|nr:universal stress protein [Paracoccaceae bacterium]MDG1737216.1 universal stress protein [Paracoccaceae bacterium]MDG2257035.1 universal stress protein [Paracoccaceae bacterium]
MYKKILVPMALDHGVSEKTLAIAKSLAGSASEITALHVYELPQGAVNAYLGEDLIAEGLARAKQVLEEKTSGLDGIKTEIARGHAYRTIIEYANANDFDCIVIGSHKPGLSTYLIGSTAARVVRHAPCAVHVHRDC